MTKTRTATVLLAFVLAGWLASGCGKAAFNATGPTPTCTHALASTAQAVHSDGGVFSTAIVTTSASCSWSATSEVSWIVLTAASGSGNSAVAYVVEPNAGSIRRGTITVSWTGGRMQLTVIQDPRS